MKIRLYYKYDAVVEGKHQYTWCEESDPDRELYFTKSRNLSPDARPGSLWEFDADKSEEGKLTIQYAGAKMIGWHDDQKTIEQWRAHDNIFRREEQLRKNSKSLAGKIPDVVDVLHEVYRTLPVTRRALWLSMVVQRIAHGK